MRARRRGLSSRGSLPPRSARPRQSPPGSPKQRLGGLLDLEDPLVADALHNAAAEPSLLPGLVDDRHGAAGQSSSSTWSVAGIIAVSGDAEVASEVTTAHRT